VALKENTMIKTRLNKTNVESYTQ